MIFSKTRNIFFLLFLCALYISQCLKLEKIRDVCKGMSKKPFSKTLSPNTYFITRYHFKVVENFITTSAVISLFTNQSKPEKQTGLMKPIIWKKINMFFVPQLPHQMTRFHKRMLQEKVALEQQEKKKTEDIDKETLVDPDLDGKKNQNKQDYMSPDEHKKEEDNKEKDNKEEDNKEEDNKEKDNKEEDNKEEDNEEEDNDTEFHDAIQELIIYFKDLPPLIGPDPPSIPKDPMCDQPYSFGSDAYYSLQKVHDYPFSCLCNDIELKSLPEPSAVSTKTNTQRIHCSNSIAYCQYDLHNQLYPSF